MPNLVRIVFKHPDPYGALRSEGLKKDEEIHAALEKLNKYLRYGEYLHIDLDLDTGEARIVKQGE